MKASELFIKCLESEGVEYIFGLPGEETNDLMLSLLDSKIKFILTRHEQGAAFMADVYGRLTQNVGVCLSTLGPGATNLITGVASANMDRSPVLAITGQTDSKLRHKESHQNMNVISLFNPITKWGWSIHNSDIIPEIVRKAFKISTEEKAGAVHLELPTDVAKSSSRASPIAKHHSLSKSIPSKDLVKDAVKMILSSKMPMILVGNGCIRGNASYPLRAFTERTGIYSINTFMAKGVISDKSERHLQTIGIDSADHALIALRQADLVIAIGYDLVEYSPRKWNEKLDKRIIHIDFTSSDIETYYHPDIEIVGDIAYTVDVILHQLIKEKQTMTNIKKKIIANNDDQGFKEFSYFQAPDLFKKIRKQVTERTEIFKDDLSYPIKPIKLVYDVRNALREEDIVISDVGVHKLWIAKAFNTYLPNTCLITNGFCSMGFALPGAIAAQLVKPNQKVVVMCGDGSFLMNIQELETAVRLHLPIIIVVWCDLDFSMISLKQTHEFGKSVFTRFNNPDFVKLAQSFGAVGYYVKCTEDFPNILEKAKESTSVPVIIAIDVDNTKNLILLNDDAKC